ncbi:hypothetical protein [Acinetobacter phage P577]|uniref:hypothetical protein n=1 Tax=Acinetobacter phage YMC13/03/R2096 TaxID=1560342 RepID=UPI00052ABDBA|nr:hypothetical protein ACQ36_gp025 [Acinetobacter phage YMC13/03/R2096]AIW02759.1 hypothetical protein BPABA577_00250 [Acinetobacter phage YMC13/03/R2096]WNT46250.1 hypothetical protein [Acinetobacter phage P577]
MKPEQFIREQGLPEAKQILEMAPEDATHYRDLSCGTRYTKNVSETECYVWTNKHWRRSVVPYQIFTSEVIKPLSELKRLVESVDLVNSLGGLKAARSEAHKDCFVYNQPLLAAIAAYESIYGGGDE